MRRRKVKIKEDKWKKLYVKLKPSKRNMYRQYLVITSKVSEYVKLNPLWWICKANVFIYLIL